jgi:hypothetical protein
MQSMERKRPLFATIICIGTALFLARRLFLMLPGHQPVLTPQMAQFQSHAPWFSLAIMLIEIALSAGGIVALWLMRPIAAAIYAAKILTSIIDVSIGIFVFHVVQVEQAILASPGKPLAQPTMAQWATWALPILSIVFIVSFQVLLFLYVWRVTARPPAIREKPKFVQASSSPN